MCDGNLSVSFLPHEGSITKNPTIHNNNSRSPADDECRNNDDRNAERFHFCLVDEFLAVGVAPPDLFRMDGGLYFEDALAICLEGVTKI